jgi:hypothetical protein
MEERVRERGGGDTWEKEDYWMDREQMNSGKRRGKEKRGDEGREGGGEVGEGEEEGKGG